MSIATTDLSLDETSAKNQKFNELFLALEDLLKRIADTDDPDIRRKRAQVRAEMIAVKNNPNTLQAPAGPLRVDPVHHLPDGEAWGQQALVALAGAAVALSVFRHSS
jgi:hypothetical protein